MSMRITLIGSLCAATLSVACPTGAMADLTAVQAEMIGSTQTNWSTATPGLQGINPLMFNKFDPGLGTLNSVNLSMTYSIAVSATMTFTTASTITLASGYPLTAGGPLQGTTIDLNLSSDPNAATLLSAQAPVLTFTKTYDPDGGSQTFSTSNPPGSPWGLAADGGASTTLSGTTATTLTGASRLAPFSGPGIIGLPALAFSGSSFSSDTGNGGGMVLTYAGISVRLSYNYTAKLVPEPSSAVLLGLAGVGLLGFRRFRARRSAF